MGRALKKPLARKAAPEPVWGVNTLRLTLFCAVPVGLTIELWRKLTKREPTEMKMLPQTTFSGPTDLGLLTISVVGERADVLLRPAVAEGDGPGNILATIGELAVTLDSFELIVNKFLTGQKAVRRIAFGAILFQHYPDRLAATKRVTSYLHDLKLNVTDDVTDLFYQINKRRSPKTKGGPKDLQINRLSKWSTIEIKQALMSLDMPGRTIVSPETQIAARLELDISTNVELSKFIPVGILKPLYKELTTLAVEIATAGDID